MEIIPIDFGGGYGQTVTDDNAINSLLKLMFRDTKFTILSVANSNGDVADVIETLKKKGMVNNDDSNS